MNETAMPDAATQAPEVAAPMPGAILLEERRRQSLSVTDVARQLKLSPRQVEALERDDYAALPGPVFVRGFMRNYARMLGVDAEPLLRSVEATLAPGKSDTPVEPGPVPRPGQTAASAATEMPGSGGRNRMPLYVVSAVIILVTAYVATRDRTPPLAPMDVPVVATPTEVPSAIPAPAEPPATEPAASDPNPAPVAAVPVPAPAPVVPQAATSGTATPATSTAAPADAPAELSVGRSGPEMRLRFERESWVEVRNGNGNVIFAQLSPAGSVRIVRGLPPLSLVVGNASGVTLTFKGKAVDLAPHTRTDVARLTLE